MILHNVALFPYTMLRVGGPADTLLIARDIEALADEAIRAQQEGRSLTILGWGSNVVPSDLGVRGLVVINQTRNIKIVDRDQRGATLVVDSGASFQDLFLFTAQNGLTGFEFAVGIPGSVGGAIVSNAGAYRSEIGKPMIDVELVADGCRRTVSPAFLQLSYRDSILRRDPPPPIVLLRATFRLEYGDSKAIYDAARDFQRQRISKQPPQSSVGSFFKNVYDQALADSLPNLPERLRAAGVVPSGYLIEHAGLAGAWEGGARLSPRHANFIVNAKGASAMDVRRLATRAKQAVLARFAVQIEEEALYLGDWSNWPA